MGDLQATIEFLVELYKFYNVDLFIRGYYQFRLSFKPPKSSHAIQVEVCEGHGERGAFTLFPAFVTNDGQTAVSRTFNIYYKDEEVLLKDVFLFRVHLLIDSAKAADCIDKAALEMTVDVHFTDQVVRESDYTALPLVTSRTLKFHFSCFNGLHHQVPLLFDYYYFSVLDMIVHANVVALSLPNWSILKQIKTGWFSKSMTTPRSTPLFYTTLFGSRALGAQSYSDATLRSICIQFYSDVSLRYAVTNTNSISREHFEKASAVHRNLCAILAMAHSQLLNYFDEMMHYLDEKHRIKLAEKLDPADLVEGLCKKLETLQSCEEVFDEMCSDMSVLNNELALLWLQFQESFTLSDQIRPVLREQHHCERMLHLSEAFFIHELPWQSLLNVTDSSFQKHLSMGQCVKSSRYLSLIPPVTVECAEVDGDSSSTPIFFEDRYVNDKGKNLENLLAAQIHGEDEVLEHKPLAFGILNKAFKDNSPQVTDSAGSSDDIDVDTRDVWVDIKADQENGVAGVTHKDQHTTGNECKVTEKVEGDDKGHERTDDVPDGDGKLDINASTTNAEETNISENVGSTEASDGKTAKTLLEHSMENSLNSIETPQRANADLTETCTTQGNQEHCRSMESTNDSEIRDVSEITFIDIAAEEQKSSDTEVVTASEQSKLDSQHVNVVDGAIANLSKDKPDIAGGLSELSKGSKDIEASAGCGRDCLKELTTQLQDDVHESKIPNCFTSTSNSECKHPEEVDNVSSLAAGMEEINSDVAKQTNSTTSSEKVSSNNVESTSKKVSSVRYIGCSDTTTGDSNKEVDSKKIRESGTAVGSGSTQHVAEVKNISQVQVRDKIISAGKDNAHSTKKIYKNGEQTVSPTGSEKEDKTKVITNEPDCNHVDNSLSKKPIKVSLTIDVTEAANGPPADNSLESGDVAPNHSDKSFKVRNTAAQVNSGTKSSNSVFYAGVSLQENSTETDLQNRQISNMQLDALKLASKSSSDVISCFCGGKLVKTSSPYRPINENDASNIILQKAKKEVISRMNYCGTLYSDFSAGVLVKPYFFNPKPDLSQETVHFVVCVHGLDGNSGDLRLLRCFLEMALPTTKFEFLMSEVNQDNTFVTFEKQTEQLVSEILHHMEAYRISPSRISFIGHSLGNIIIRSALNHPQMEPYVELFHTYLSLSGPHLGMVHHTSSLVSTGMWLLQKWKKSDSLLQLSLNDSTDMRDTFIYKLSKTKGLEYFTNVLLVSSVQDHYAPFHSSRIELPKSLRSNSQEYTVYREMMENLLTPLLSQPNRSLVRYTVYHCLPSSTNTFIGRAAHIAMLDSELFIEKFICTSAAKYFQ